VWIVIGIGAAVIVGAGAIFGRRLTRGSKKAKR
jgi:hypothetical protein